MSCLRSAATAAARPSSAASSSVCSGLPSLGAGPRLWAMYYLTIRQFARSLRNLDAVLTKAETYAAKRGFDVNNLISARLAPDMLPFVAQIRIACDNAKA